ncbi:MAG TPA: hypothetical protein DEF41_11925 [Desulfovibrio sp.]|nr:hypothetical protein [Desulfovibrio sp.]
MPNEMVNMMDFDGLWAAAAPHLDALFKDGSHRARKDRLRDIYETTETWWERYVDLIPGRTVRYLMITEAPPWNAEYDSLQRVSTPVYALNPERAISPMLRQCYRTFYPDTPCDDAQEALRRIASKGFLLLDGLPFALSYRTSQRKRLPYLEIQRMALSSYAYPKLRSSGLAWSTDLRVIFGYKYHALAFIQASDGFMHLDGVHGSACITVVKDHIINDNIMPGYKNMRKGFAL